MSNANIASSKTTDLRATGSILIDEFNPAGDDANADWAQKGLFMSPTVVAARPADLTGFYVTVANNYGKLQLTDPDALVAPGATTQVLFNNAGVIAGDADFTFTPASNTLNIAGPVTGVTQLTVGAQMTGTATLVAGTVTVNSSIVAAGDSIIVTQNTPGGTTGTHYTVANADITAGVSFVIEATDTAGALVNTDTSTVNWLIIH